MTKNLSAIKKNQIALRNNIRNKSCKSTIKTCIKKAVLEMNKLESMNYEKAFFLVSQAYSKIDKGVKKGIITRNSAARKKSILSNKLKKIKAS